MTGSSPDPAPDRYCALVLGMHRSGTSAVARTISLIGAGLPRLIMAASGSNEAGFWEPRQLVDISDRMLLEGGSAYNDWRHFEPNAALGSGRAAAFRAQLRRAIEEEFAGQALFVLKDPRISRFAPLYIDVLASMGVGVKVVIVTRHPMEVAGSLGKRDDMPVADALLLWLRHNVEAEVTTRGLDRIVLSYEALMKEPEAAIGRLQGLLAPVTPADAVVDAAAARASLRGELRHQKTEPIRAETLPEAAEWAIAAMAAFGALETDEADGAARAAIDDLLQKIDEDARRHGDRIAYLLAAARRAQLEVQDLMRQRDIGISMIRELESDNDRARQEYQQLELAFARYQRARIIELAANQRADFKLPDDVPKSLSPWRLLNAEKRRRVRQRLNDYLTILASPLFDADYYERAYPDVAKGEMMPALHYLLYGSDEGRKPSEIVEPKDVLEWFPELRDREGNLVLNLIDLHSKPGKP